MFAPTAAADAAANRLADRLEYATTADPARNYCLWDYAPAAPVEDKFRAINLLLQSFDHAGMPEPAYALLDALREAIGPFRTVFGVKLVQGRLAWEFYFYDYARTGRSVSASRVLAALAPFAPFASSAGGAPCTPQVDERLPYFMFSLDIDAALAAGQRAIDVVHVYIGNPGSTVSSGIAYALRDGGMTLENFYFFFDAVKQRQDAADKILCSAHLDQARVHIDDILWPELRDCTTLCVANKSGHDCIYFSGVVVDQLLHFLQRLGYPTAVQHFVRTHRNDLDHLRFDVGFDYRWQGDALAVLKSGYYGVF